MDIKEQLTGFLTGLCIDILFGVLIGMIVLVVIESMMQIFADTANNRSIALLHRNMGILHQGINV